MSNHYRGAPDDQLNMYRDFRWNKISSFFLSLVLNFLTIAILKLASKNIFNLIVKF